MSPNSRADSGRRVETAVLQALLEDILNFFCKNNE
jgi:hypothetical protein